MLPQKCSVMIFFMFEASKFLNDPRKFNCNATENLAQSAGAAEYTDCISAEE